METVEILAGAEFANAITALGLSAVCTYRVSEAVHSQYMEWYQVWELSEDDFNILCQIEEENWKENWGWWRHAKGSNMGYANREFIVNGEKILAWDGYKRTSWAEEDCHDNCSAFKRGLCDATKQDAEGCFGAREYTDIISYLCNEVGASTERNVCACTIDLARQNGITLAELFKKYLG